MVVVKLSPMLVLMLDNGTTALSGGQPHPASLVDARGRAQPTVNLAALASERDVYLGCNCPTKANPRVDRCHTALALRFMKERFPELEVVFPA